jgi:hypothetical protein
MARGRAAGRGKKKAKKNVPRGSYIQATFNNTIVTITDMEGNTLRGRPRVIPDSRVRGKALVRSANHRSGSR